MWWYVTQMWRKWKQMWRLVTEWKQNWKNKSKYFKAKSICEYKKTVLRHFAFNGMYLRHILDRMCNMWLQFALQLITLRHILDRVGFVGGPLGFSEIVLRVQWRRSAGLQAPPPYPAPRIYYPVEQNSPRSAL